MREATAASEMVEVDEIAADLVAFARRERPVQGASRPCDQRSEPHLWVVGVPDDGTLAELTARAADHRPAEIDFAVRFEIESPPYGLRHGCIDGYLDIVVLTGDGDPWDRAIASEPDGEIAPVEDLSLYGPDYDAIDHIIEFVHDICTVLAGLDADARAGSLARLAAARSMFGNQPAFSRNRRRT